MTFDEFMNSPCLLVAYMVLMWILTAWGVAFDPMTPIKHKVWLITLFPLWFWPAFLVGTVIIIAYTSRETFLSVDEYGRNLIGYDYVVTIDEHNPFQSPLPYWRNDAVRTEN